MHKLYLMICMLIFMVPAYATSFIQKEIPNAKMVASGRLTVFLFDVYDASFYTENGKREATPPYALKLSYLRDISGEKIADQSAEEMRKQERVDEITIADWHSQMRHIFPNVKKGDSITGIYKDNDECIFFKNNTSIGQVNDKQFCDVFFDIWFGEKTSEPALRNKLIGQK